ncbi:MAG: cytochrome c oxidase assembly protein [Acidimicrobiia bacterium]
MVFAAATQDVWRWQPHPEVWLLVAGLLVAYVYSAKVIGPKMVRNGEPPVSKAQWRWFAGAMLMLWVASDWPIHDIGEKSLYSGHMLQHMMLSYFMPPMALFATPTWLARLLIGKGRGYAAMKWLTKPVVAGVVFNGLVMVTHIPGVVNYSVGEGATNGLVHYLLHTMVVLTSMLAWMCICGPIPEFRISYGGQMIFLFSMSIIPTVPAGWLTFADGVVYKSYNHGGQIWGLSPTYDQQIAGAIMKIGGSIFLWIVVVVLFFKRFAAGWESSNSYKKVVRSSAPLVGLEEKPLTWDEVEQHFAKVPPAPEPDSSER